MKMSGRHESLLNTLSYTAVEQIRQIKLKNAVTLARGLLGDAIHESQEQNGGEMSAEIGRVFEIDAGPGREPFVLLVSLNYSHNVNNPDLEVTLVGGDQDESLFIRQYGVEQTDYWLDLRVISGLDDLMVAYNLMNNSDQETLDRIDSDIETESEDYDQLLELLMIARGQPSKVARHVAS
jgi:hypothetical protein